MKHRKYEMYSDEEPMVQIKISGIQMDVNHAEHVDVFYPDDSDGESHEFSVPLVGSVDFEAVVETRRGKKTIKGQAKAKKGDVCRNLEVYVSNDFIEDCIYSEYGGYQGRGGGFDVDDYVDFAESVASSRISSVEDKGEYVVVDAAEYVWTFGNKGTKVPLENLKYGHEGGVDIKNGSLGSRFYIKADGLLRDIYDQIVEKIGLKSRGNDLSVLDDDADAFDLLMMQAGYPYGMDKD